MVMGTPCGALFVSGCGVWPGVSMCGGTCVPGATGSPGNRISGSLPSGGLQRVQLFSGAEEAPGCSSISWRMKGVREFIEKITSGDRMPRKDVTYKEAVKQDGREFLQLPQSTCLVTR